MAECRVEGCGRPVYRIGLCQSHRRDLEAGREMHDIRPMRESVEEGCSFEGCDRPHMANGYCATHNRQAKAGMELRPIRPTARKIRGEPVPECAIEGCGAKTAALTQLCGKHRWQAKTFGISDEKLIALLSEENCAICGTELTKRHIDHDHACCPDGYSCCGECIRGVLCPPCNFMLGNARDNVETLTRAVAYLEAA